MTQPNDDPLSPDPAGAGSAPAPQSSPAPEPSPVTPPPYTGDPQPKTSQSSSAQTVRPLEYGTPGSDKPQYSGPAPTTDDKNMATIAHVLGIFTSFLGPLIIWLVKKDQSPFVDDQGKEALNFQLTLLIGYLVAAITTVICIGPFIAMGLSIVAIIFGIMGAVASNKGEAYRYPVNIRFIK